MADVEGLRGAAVAVFGDAEREVRIFEDLRGDSVSDFGPIDDVAAPLAEARDVRAALGASSMMTTSHHDSAKENFQRGIALTAMVGKLLCGVKSQRRIL